MKRNSSREAALQRKQHFVGEPKIFPISKLSLSLSHQTQKNSDQSCIFRGEKKRIILIHFTSHHMCVLCIYPKSYLRLLRNIFTLTLPLNTQFLERGNMFYLNAHTNIHIFFSHSWFKFQIYWLSPYISRYSRSIWAAPSSSLPSHELLPEERKSSTQGRAHWDRAGGWEFVAVTLFFWHI